MKDVILNFSWERLISLPPTEFLAFLLLAGIAVVVALGLLIFVIGLMER
jgi:hypothetical protein